MVTLAPPLNTIVFRVRAPRASIKVAKLCRGAPSAPLRAETLARAAAERRAGATGSVRAGGASSVKHSGAHALRRCQTR